jgi:hypothetical protein
MALDFDAQAGAIAARFLAGALTAPTGYATIRSSTANPPGMIGPTPCVITTISDGSFVTGNGSRQGEADWHVRFYLDQTSDLERSEVALRKWLGVLVDQLKASAQLGGSVQLALVRGFKVGILTYAGIDYAGIELEVRTTTTEGWTATA